MKHEAFLYLFVLLVSSNSFADTGSAVPQPTWMNADMPDVQAPVVMSEAEQEQCTEVILNEINRRTELSLSSEAIVPIRMSSWQQPERGFVRGGGFNIRVVATVAKPPEELKHVHPGRYADFMTVLKLGDESSLHLPPNIDEQQTYFETDDERGTHLDFVAHVDSAYAYLPVGLFIHLFTDVVGASTRNPCPVEVDDRF